MPLIPGKSSSIHPVSLWHTIPMVPMLRKKKDLSGDCSWLKVWSETHSLFGGYWILFLSIEDFRVMTLTCSFCSFRLFPQWLYPSPDLTGAASSLFQSSPKWDYWQNENRGTGLALAVLRWVVLFIIDILPFPDISKMICFSIFFLFNLNKMMLSIYKL